MALRPAIRVSLGILAALAARTALGEELHIPFERYELPNGLEVILSEDHSTPVAHVEVWYHVGSKDEPPHRSGFAHLFEHLMFEGSEHRDTGYFDALQPLGAQVNGTTDTDRTNYWETVPSNVLERALWLEADRMGFLLPVLGREKLEIQKDVVRNERRQNYEVAPYGEVSRAIAEAVWPEGHPYHRLTIGLHEDIDAATLDDVRGFFGTWYVPANATLAVVGDFDPAQTRDWIERYFGPIPARPEPARAAIPDAAPPAAVTVELADDVGLARVYMAWRSMPLFEAGDADLDVLSSILVAGKSSRLYRRLVFSDRIARDVGAWQDSQQLGSTYEVVATVAPGHTVEEVQGALEEEIERVRLEGVSAAEVSRARDNWRRRFFSAIESVAGRAGRLQSYNQFAGDPGWVQADLDRYLAVTEDSVREQARRWLDPGHRVTVIVRPERQPARDDGGEQ